MARPMIRATAAAAALGLLGGCVILTAGVRDGELLPDRRLAALKDGVTTRAQVLEAFGPPLRVARRGAASPEDPDLFEPFGAVAPAASDVAWWYRAERSKERWTGVSVLKFDAGEGTSFAHAADDLWLLLDGETGRLRAHLHRRTDSEKAARPTDASGPYAAPWGPGAAQ